MLSLMPPCSPSCRDAFTHVAMLSLMSPCLYQCREALPASADAPRVRRRDGWSARAFDSAEYIGSCGGPSNARIVTSWRVAVECPPETGWRAMQESARSRRHRLLQGAARRPRADPGLLAMTFAPRPHRFILRHGLRVPAAGHRRHGYEKTVPIVAPQYCLRGCWWLARWSMCRYQLRRHRSR